MRTTIQNLSDLQDRRIMMDKKLPPYGYAFVILTGLFMIFLVIWSTQTNRIYVSQNSGVVQAANKTYIMSSSSGSITELYVSEGSYVNEGDLIARLKSTDLDMQKDNLQSQLDIYQKQLDQYNKLLKCIQDDTNYFDEANAEDQPYYYQYQTYKSQVAQKTFDAMEAKRLGLCQKSLFVVPNHLTEQWASEFLNLYPNAKLLVARRKDFETANRKKFCARIATGDYDAVIIGHSQFERIPLSFERQERIVQEQIYETLAAINELKVHAGENFSIKQMEKSRKNLEQKLEKLRAADCKDDVITFEQLGVDRLFVDESHAFKNLFLYTKMRNVAGLSTSEAQKSSDMFGKCRYLDEITGGRGVVFATGTPVSNSMTELYTVMRYLQYSTLQQKKLTHFDCWASTFGETTTAIELAPEGYTLIGR